MMQNNREKSRIHVWVALLACVLVMPLLLWEYVAKAQPVTVANAPLFMPASNHFPHPITVQLSGAPTNSQIYYTLDGNNPQKEGMLYNSPIIFNQNGVMVVRTSYQNADGSWSQIAGATYVIGLDTSLPVLSVIAEPAGLYSPDHGLLTNPYGRGIEWEREAQLMFFEGDRSGSAQTLAFTSPAGLRVHGSASRGYAKLSYRLYFRTDYGNPRLNYPLYAGQQNMSLESFDRLVLHSGAQDHATPLPDLRSNWTLLRAALFYELAAELGVYTAQSRPALLFINGQSQGIYQIRTFVDETYLQDRYGVVAQDFFTISGDPGSPGALFEPATVAQPGKAAWIELLTFLEANDVRNEVVYEELGGMIDLDNFIDYVILQFYAGNTDWLRNNVKLFRPQATGKWSWALWDVDYSYGLSPWSNVETNMFDWLYTTERPGFEQGSLLLRKLLENETFRARFSARLDELLHSTLASEKVAAQLDGMAAEMRPDIEYEQNLWTSSGDWEASVAEMRDFVVRRPDILWEDFEEWRLEIGD